MKKFLFSLIAVGLSVASFAQPATISYKKRPTLSVNFLLKDMKTADLIDHSSLASVLNNGQWTNIRDMAPGLGLSYFQGLTEHIDFMGTLGGSYVKYPFSYKSGVTPPANTRFLLEASANLNFKLLTDKYFMVPYFSLGLGASMYAGTYYMAHMPTALGLQFNLGENTFLTTQFGYNAKISNLATNHLTYSLGMASPIKEKKAAPVVVAPPPPPAPVDTDGDGITDDKDKCPTVAGVAKYDGCPVPDTDGDGINDDNDKCPTVKGLAKYNGCPVPDTDKDGINDEEDKCPTVPGVKENNGCPVIKEEVVKKVAASAKKIFFATGSSKLLAKSFKSLNDVATILKEDAALKLDIEGHTDNTGSDKVNLPLSQKRAQSVYDYLTTKGGIDANRISHEGFGSSKPVADNKTAKGRGLNRRVEMKLKYY